MLDWTSAPGWVPAGGSALIQWARWSCHAHAPPEPTGSQFGASVGSAPAGAVPVP